MITVRPVVRGVLAGLLATCAITAVSLAGPAVAAPATAEGAFTPVGVQRIVDTRSGLGATAHPVAAGQTIDVAVAGHGGVPSTGVSAVAVDVTALAGTSSSTFLTVYPTGFARPAASSLHAGRATARNLVIARLGAGGALTIYNDSGDVDVVVDVEGWFASSAAPASTGGDFQETRAQRILDTTATTPLLGRQTLTQPVSYRSGASNPDPHLTALAVTITVGNATQSGSLVAWDGVGDAPAASVVSFSAGRTVSNLVIVPVGPCTTCLGTSTGLPSITLLNASDGPIDVLVDIHGFFDDGSLGGTGALRYRPLTAPVRIADSRDGLGGLATFHGSKTEAVTAPASVADAATGLVVQNLTAIASSDTTVTTYRRGFARPGVRDLSPRAGTTSSGSTFTGVGAGNDFDVHNSAGTLGLIVDTVGSFEYAN